MSWMTTKLATAAAPQNPSSNGVRAAESGRQYFQLGCITYEEVGPPNNVNCTFQPFCCNCLNPGSTLISAIPAAFVYSTHLLDSQLDFLVHWRNPAPSVQFPCWRGVYLQRSGKSLRSSMTSCRCAAGTSWTSAMRRKLPGWWYGRKIMSCPGNC